MRSADQISKNKNADKYPQVLGSTYAAPFTYNVL